MTEQDWLKATDPTPMLEFLRDKVSERKLLMFCVGCWRRIWPLLTDWSSRRSVDVLELLAEGNSVEVEQIPWTISCRGRFKAAWTFDTEPKLHAKGLATS